MEAGDVKIYKRLVTYIDKKGIPRSYEHKYKYTLKKRVPKYKTLLYHSVKKLDNEQCKEILEKYNLFSDSMDI